MKHALGRLGRGLGTVIAVAGLAFVGWAVVRRWDEIGDGVRSVSPGRLLLAIAAAAAGMTTIALAWRSALAVCGVQMSRPAALKAYFRGEAGKYIPGSVWAVVGRAELAVRSGARRSDAYYSVVLGLAALYAGALVVSVTTVFAVTGDPRIRIAAALGPAAAAGLLLNRVAWDGASNLLRRATKGAAGLPGRGQFLRLVGLSLPAWPLIGLGTWILTRSLWPEAPFTAVLFATSVSWLGGFLAVPVPGGLGVREGLFVAALAGAPLGAAAASAVLARLVFMLVDGAGAALGSISRARAPDRG